MKNISEFDLVHQNKLDHQIFAKFFVEFLKNSINCIVSRAVLGVLLDALKVALLRVITL